MVKKAFADVARIAEFYSETASPLVARDAIDVIRAAGQRISKDPLIYRFGMKRGTRECVIRLFPLVVVFRIESRKIVALRVLHQSQKYFNR